MRTNAAYHRVTVPSNSEAPSGTEPPPASGRRRAHRSSVIVDRVRFDRVTMQEAVQQILGMVRRRDGARYVCTGNVDHLVMLSRDADFRATYDGADLVLADGMPVVWLSKIGGDPLPERVTGSDLFWELGRASAETGLRLFFLGGLASAADVAAERVRERFPGAQIVGTYCPPHDRGGDPAEQRRIRELVRAAKPDVLLVAFGAPKQEKWIVANKDLLGVPVCIGIGASLDMAAGVVKRAPRWMQRAGLEWFGRFVQEPGRLFRRYFIADGPYLLGAIARTAVLRARRRTPSPRALER
jgi:N-acetylglucosaminyldiphosphoundecaprenol N-acetyl-beta-D-mannosaminyltransferase